MTNLRYKEYQFTHNPRKLTVKLARNTVTIPCLGFGSAVQEMGPGVRVVEGEGEFFGENVMEQFSAMEQIFSEGGSGTLSGAGLEPMKALFQDLMLTGQGGEQVLSYFVRFVEERSI